jgi:FkbM family methyltransferase
MHTLEERDLSSWLKENLPRFHKSKVNDHLPAFEIIPNGLYFFLIQSFLKRYSIRPQGMIHVGGHLGHEILPYALLGFEKVLIIEPLEPAVERLQGISAIYNGLAESCVQVFGGMPFVEIFIEPCAAGEKEGSTKLYVTRESALSSTHRPISEVQVNGVNLSEVTMEQAIQIRPLDKIIEEKYAGIQFNGIRVNVQGDELAVFRGAANLIGKLDFIFCEANYDQRYEGIPTTEELVGFLETHNHTLVRHDKLSDSVGNLLFLNNNLISNE